MSIFAYLHFRTHKQWYFSQYIILEIVFSTSRTFSGMPESASLYESYLWILFRAFARRELNGLFSQIHISGPMWDRRVRIGWYFKEITAVTEKKGPSFFFFLFLSFVFFSWKKKYIFMWEIKAKAFIINTKRNWFCSSVLVQWLYLYKGQWMM